VNYCVAAGALEQSYGQRAGRGEAILILRHLLKIDQSPNESIRPRFQDNKAYKRA